MSSEIMTPEQVFRALNDPVVTNASKAALSDHDKAQRERIADLEREKQSAISVIQKHQRGGSPPPGDWVMLLGWVLETLELEVAEARGELSRWRSPAMLGSLGVIGNAVTYWRTMAEGMETERNRAFQERDEAWNTWRQAHADLREARAALETERATVAAWEHRARYLAGHVLPDAVSGLLVYTGAEDALLLDTLPASASALRERLRLAGQMANHIRSVHEQRVGTLNELLWLKEWDSASAGEEGRDG